MKHEPKPDSDLILYQTEDGRTRLQVRLQGDTVWLTQAQMAELFQRERSVITKHIRNLFEEGELVEQTVCANHAHTATDSKTYQTIQNKLHFAATGKTAAELIAERADSSQPNMGLTAWHGGVVRKGDVTVAKNYLREDEIEITLVSVNKRENFLPDFTRGRINLKGGSPTLTVGNFPARGLKARNMTAQQRRETSAALGHDVNQQSSPEGAAELGLTVGFGAGPVLSRPFRAGNVDGRFTQGVARGLAVPWAVMLSRFQRCDKIDEYVVGHGPQLAPGEPAADRKDYQQVFLFDRLQTALRPKLRLGELRRRVRASHAGRRAGPQELNHAT